MCNMQKSAMLRPSNEPPRMNHRCCPLPPTPAHRLLITELIEEVSPVLPNPCRFQNYNRSMFPLSLITSNALQDLKKSRKIMIRGSVEETCDPA